ncbi:MAG: hypothetical protein J1G38_01550 [Clostridiales bacterium]|nr:hypothetical protein [Clostridiales bacterium]
MIKKLRICIIIAVAACLVASVFLMLTACAQSEHNHTYGEWSETAATCETAGKRTRVCTECGKADIETIDPLGHLWNDGEVTEKATCENSGIMTYTCTRADCGKTKPEDIKPLGHDWQEESEIKPATCEDDGLRSAACSRCDAREDEQVIPALGHDWKIDTVRTETCRHGGEYLHTCKRVGCGKTDTVTTEPVDHKWDGGVTVAAKCESEGSVTYTCTFECGTQKVDKLDALGHQWGIWKTQAEATCTEKGSEKRDCTRIGCDKSETRDVAKLGHSFSSDYTVDKAPTLEEDGSKSKHCVRSGCNARDDIQTIPKLDANTKIDYTVTIKDPCGEQYYGAATIGFYLDDRLVEEVPMSNSTVTTVSLGANNYTVKFTDLTKGYFTDKEQYAISANNPQLTVLLNAAVIDGTAGGTKYNIGSIIYDYSLSYYDDPDGNLKSTLLSEILKGKKGIFLNFYFKGCVPCVNEMPEIVSVGNKYGDDIQFLMVNDTAHGNQDSDILYFQSTYAKNSKLWFVNRARSLFLYNYFTNLIGGFPTTILIDCNGQVVFAHTGTMTEASFTSALETYIINRYNKLHPTAETASMTAYCEAVLPSRKFDLLDF